MVTIFFKLNVSFVKMMHSSKIQQCLTKHKNKNSMLCNKKRKICVILSVGSNSSFLLLRFNKNFKTNQYLLINKYCLWNKFCLNKNNIKNLKLLHKQNRFIHVRCLAFNFPISFWSFVLGTTFLSVGLLLSSLSSTIIQIQNFHNFWLSLNKDWTKVIVSFKCLNLLVRMVGFYYFIVYVGKINMYIYGPMLTKVVTQGVWISRGNLLCVTNDLLTQTIYRVIRSPYSPVNGILSHYEATQVTLQEAVNLQRSKTRQHDLPTLNNNLRNTMDNSPNNNLFSSLSRQVNKGKLWATNNPDQFTTMVTVSLLVGTFLVRHFLGGSSPPTNVSGRENEVVTGQLRGRHFQNQHPRAEDYNFQPINSNTACHHNTTNNNVVYNNTNATAAPQYQLPYAPGRPISSIHGSDVLNTENDNLVNVGDPIRALDGSSMENNLNQTQRASLIRRLLHATLENPARGASRVFVFTGNIAKKVMMFLNPFGRGFR